MLFGDLETQEAYEQNRISPATAGSDYRARECLVELFGKPASVKASDRPFPEFSSDAERARLVEAAP